MATKEERLALVKIVYDAGRIKKFEDIFGIIPKTVVAVTLGINVNRFSDHIKNPKLLDLKTIDRIAELFDLSPWDILKLIYEEKPR